MKAGDVLNPIETGNQAIDVKTILKECGFVVPQTSVDNFNKIPAEAELKIAECKVAQSKYEMQKETAVFTCKYCGERNSANYKKEVETGDIFLVCGNCNTVVEVK